jgi:hypothetical protein
MAIIPWKMSASESGSIHRRQRGANMKKERALIVRLVPLCCLLLLLSAAVGLMSEAMAVPAATTVEQWVVAAGGGHAEGAPYSLDGTVGQAVVGSSSQTSYGLCSGFWCGVRGYLGESVFLPVVVRNH